MRTEMTAGLVYVAFGRLAPTSEVLSAPEAPSSKPFLIAMRHYARGETFARLGNSVAVRHELNQLRSYHERCGVRLGRNVCHDCSNRPTRARRTRR
jgi:hypothetical protein